LLPALFTVNVTAGEIIYARRVVFVLLLLLPSVMAAQTLPSGSAFTLKHLGSNVWAAIDSGGAKANAGFVIGADSVAVIDTFFSRQAAEQLLAEIRRRTNLPVKFVINTSYRWEHVAGNDVFKEAGAVILAHRNVRQWINTENVRYLGAPSGNAENAALQLVPPQMIYDHSVDLFLGARLVRVVWRLGATGGDSAVLVPDANVVFCGDLFLRKTLPNLADASTGPWLTTLEVLARSHRSETFVPGHGGMGTADDVLEFRQFLLELRNFTGAALRDGKSGEGLAATVLDALRGKYGQWAEFESLAKRNVLDTASELRGEKKIPRPADVD
jgi:cyclase